MLSLVCFGKENMLFSNKAFQIEFLKNKQPFCKNVMAYCFHLEFVFVCKKKNPTLLLHISDPWHRGTFKVRLDGFC